MEIPDTTLDRMLETIARSDLKEEVKSEQVQVKSDKRTRKFITVLANPTTALFSKDGKHKAVINAIFDTETDGYCFRVNVTNKIYTSQRMAINNARRWLKKKRTKYYKKHPEKKPRAKTVRIYPKKEKNPIKTTHKLFIMKMEAAKILVRMSEKKLKLHKKYSRKKFNSKKTTAISGNTKDFNVAIYNVMLDGTKRERKSVGKMLKSFTHEPYRKTNMFY